MRESLIVQTGSGLDAIINLHGMHSLTRDRVTSDYIMVIYHELINWKMNNYPHWSGINLNDSNPYMEKNDFYWKDVQVNLALNPAEIILYKIQEKVGK